MEIFTYNILSAPLANSDYYPLTNLEHLDQDIRWNKFLILIQALLANEVVICLQEVPNSWLGTLQLMCLQADYYFFNAVQGNIFNDFMSTVLAYPRKYGLQQIHYIPMQNLIEDPQDRVWNWIIIATTNYRNITLATVHLPCKFRDQSVMNTYTQALVNLFMNYDKVILAGDFNQTPYSEGYNILRTIFNSVHETVFGQEPPYTNYCLTKSSPDGCCNTLDYIFYKGNIRIITMEAIPPKILSPNEDNISDHIYLRALIE